MIKADLARVVYERHGGVSQREALSIVETLLERMKEHLVNGENIKLSGFGSLNVVTRRERVGRNPQTGSTLTLKRRKLVTFKPSKRVKF